MALFCIVLGHGQSSASCHTLNYFPLSTFLIYVTGMSKSSSLQFLRVTHNGRLLQRWDTNRAWQHNKQLGGLCEESRTSVLGGCPIQMIISYIYSPTKTMFYVLRHLSSPLFYQLVNWLFKQWFFFHHLWQVSPFTLTSTSWDCAIALKEWQHLISSHCIPIHHNDIP